MAKEEKTREKVKKYTKEDYEKALTDLDEKKDDDFFGRGSLTETGSSVIAIIKAIVYIVFIVAVAVALAYFAIIWVNDAFAFVKDDNPVEITIPDGITSGELADILGENEVINYPYIFKIYADLKKVDQRPDSYKFEAGTYTVNSNMNYDNLLRSFYKVKTVEEFSFTIIEGDTIDEIIGRFIEKDIGTKEGWVSAINDYDYGDNFPYIKDIPNDPDRIYRLEGYLYPSTYRFYTGQTESYYIEKILREGFNVFVYSTFSKNLEGAKYTLDEYLTIASIAEKEVLYPSDYYGVSMVIHNRLNKSKEFPCIECDSTLIYYLSHVAGTRIKVLTDNDLKDETNTYNTYIYEGLPHGPICNPSYATILAAFKPNSDYADFYYFVTDANGEALYAETKKEHEKNIKTIKGN